MKVQATRLTTAKSRVGRCGPSDSTATGARHRLRAQETSTTSGPEADSGAAAAEWAQGFSEG